MLNSPLTKYRNVFFKALLGFLLGSSSFSLLFSNNLIISNASLEVHAVNGWTYVQFDISWDNSWRSSTSAANWDAAWVFVKYRVGSGEWQHAKLSSNQNDHLAPAGSVIGAVPDSMGVFIYRDAVGEGSVDFTSAKLAWKFESGGLTNGESIDFKVLGIEMVYVPQRSFWLGDRSSTNTLREVVANQAYQVSTLKSIIMQDASGTSAGDSILESGVTIDGNGGICNTGSGAIDNPNFPTGFRSFYCMKYEASQEQYAVFLNLLSSEQAAARYDASNSGSSRYSLSGSHPEILAAAPDRACNFISVDDLAAYADWSGLRPMTELEYEKASRGFLHPLATEYAWGTTNISISCNVLTNNGLANESAACEENSGNSSYKITNMDCGTDGPLRCGIFAASSVNATREESGAGFYGIMELSGNLSEIVVSLGRPEGRNFTGLHGNGEITSGGTADVDYWPTSTNLSTGTRGGSWQDDESRLHISDRFLSGLNSDAERSEASGIRCVRSTASEMLATVSTKEITGITSNTAESGGEVILEGWSGVNLRGVSYSTSPNLDIDFIPTTSDGTGQGNFTSSIPDLTPNTTYFVRAYAINAQGTAYGQEESFTTAMAAPSVVTSTVIDITSSSATVGGEVTDDGGDPITDRGIYYSLLPDAETTGTKLAIGSGTGVFSSSLTSLTQYTIYYVKAYASNSVGTSYGQELSFMTIQIGDSYQGGIVAYILQSGDPGFVEGETKGFIAAANDQGQIQWYNGTYNTTGATATSLGTGSANTATIIAIQGEEFSYAALLCDEYISDSYCDWYLPSQDELNKLYLSQTEIGGFVANYYWSSSEYNEGAAWYQSFSNGEQSVYFGKYHDFYTRAIRSFSSAITISTPTVTTNPASDITTTTVNVGGNIVDDGGDAITEKGVYYSKFADAELTGTKLAIGSGMGEYSANMTDLSEGTIYYFKAYAKNGVRISYGEEQTFTTEGFVTDYDENTYNTVRLGDQLWMAENLKVTHYPDGSSIPLVTDNTDWANLADNNTDDAYCFYNNNSSSEYGALYTYAASLNACPAGWHLPSDAEWTELENYLADNGYNYDGTTGGGLIKIAKAMATMSGWDLSSTTGAVGNSDYPAICNASSFSSLPGGYRYNDGIGTFGYAGGYGCWWSSTEYGSTVSYFRRLGYSVAYVYRDNNYKSNGFSIRCVRDQAISAPTVTTSSATDIAETSATVGGEVTSDGGETVTEKGIYSSLLPDAESTGTKLALGSGTGVFSTSLPGLTEGTIYYIMAYATNSLGTSYGGEETFTTLSLPTLTTTAISAITDVSAESGGDITDDGGSTITARGICWNTSGNPTKADFWTLQSGETGSYSSSLTGLTTNTTYYVRAYATNSVGTEYGQEFTLKTMTGTMTDIDNISYYTVTLGAQEWMAENLKVTHYPDGSAIPHVTDNTEWANLVDNNTDDAYCYYNNNSSSEYGALYTYAAALNACPAGWHLPSDAEWTELENYLADNGYNYDGTTGGGSTKIAKAMATASGWSSHFTIGTVGNTDYPEKRNASGFSGLPGGFRYLSNGTFYNAAYIGIWWGSTEYSSTNAYGRSLHYYYSNLYLDNKQKSYGYSIRCVRDD
jgi:uncharacterized protein (TIGR02145 family)